MTKKGAGIFALTAAAGCSGSIGAFPAGPGGDAQSTIAQCGVAGEPCCSAASCDAGPACAHAPCNDNTTDGTPDVAAPLDAAGSAAADATIGAPAPVPGDYSVADGTLDNTTMGEPSGEDGSDAGVNAAADGPARDAPDDGDSAAQGGSIDLGLVALYHFDETSGTTAGDSSGNGNTATMQGGATFSPGVRGNAATLSGASQYVSLPTGIVSALTDFSISAWVYQSLAGHGHRVFDFGTGTTDNMFITTDGDLLRYAVTLGGHGAEENLLTSGTLPISIWQHLTVTQAAATATLYLNGAVVAQNAATTLHPSSLGVTTQNWIGRSQYANNPYLTGRVDEFRIYQRALSAAEVMDLFVQQR
jgi:hypothetical protein